MYTIESIIQIVITLLIATVIIFIIIKKTSLSSLKIMLAGIGLIVFMASEVGEKIRYVDEIFSVIGFGIVIAGFLKKN